ncbi:nucleotidyltransferase domain-containing protein [Sulfolobus sp. E5-1-F]|uniref:nucleotidyltransferase domain-containing protein n=1 Tax=Sulfolobaceae TaxID=118883 RepID=UPI001294F17F|nr:MULTISPECIES: nucleotidyltransferase domain-containing protein [unclassified Sulfolobus]QGA53692.1 nucleotidyltransferase domain-containing protein [Sulfolobus sp. E5-1-F]QGA68653.1 nucleotidyltransferase domain-containing protein [Sulfolobus sp. E11-6]
MGKAKSALKSQVELVKVAMEFINRISNEIKIEDVYVVGSRARGDYLETSDIDLVIISRDFEGLRYIDRLEKLGKHLRARIELFAFTPDEWKEPKSLFVEQMKKEAKRLKDLARDIGLSF